MMSEFREKYKEARGIAWEIVATLGAIATVVGAIALMFNPRGRRTGGSARRAGWSLTKRYGAVAGAEAIFALASVLFLELVAWPGTIVLGMWRNVVAWQHIHDPKYIAKVYDGNLTVNTLFAEWIFTVALWMFTIFLVVKLVQKMTLLRLAAVSGLTGLTVGFFSGLKFKDIGAVEGFRRAVGSGWDGLQTAMGVVFRKGQNENWWVTSCYLLLVLVPYFAGPVHPLLPMIISALAVCGLWEINTANGNNTDIAGRSVVETAADGTPRVYKVWDPKEKRVIDGYKPVVAGFQRTALGFLAFLIVLGAGLSFFGFTGKFIDLSVKERIETAFKQRGRQARQLEAAIVRTEIELSTVSTLEDRRNSVAEMEPPENASAARINEFESRRAQTLDSIQVQLAKLASRDDVARRLDSLRTASLAFGTVDTAAVRDSIREAVVDRMNTVDALLPGKIKVSAKYETPNGLPPPKVEETYQGISGFLMRLGWNASGSRAYLEYWLFLAISVGIAFFGARLGNAWIRLGMWCLAVWVFCMTSGISNGLINGMIGICVMTFLFGLFGRRGAQTQAAHGH